MSAVDVSSPVKNDENLEQEGSGKYHSLPESGEAGGVGLSRTHKDVENPVSSMQSFEQEHVQKQGKSWLVKVPDPSCSTLPAYISANHPFSNSLPPVSSRFSISAAQLKTITTVLYMSVFAVLGSLLRIVLAQLFGEECKNPGTVGWLAAASPLCVTADGEVDEVNGIIFAVRSSLLSYKFFRFDWFLHHLSVAMVRHIFHDFFWLLLYSACYILLLLSTVWYLLHRTFHPTCLVRSLWDSWSQRTLLDCLWALP